MKFFTYTNGTLYAEACALPALAAAVGTPFFCYSSAALEQAYGDFAGALEGLNATTCYALKANSNLAVVSTLARLGAGADVVSEGELRRALQAGVPPEKIVFAGVGKTAGEMAAALDAGILQLNVESLPELEALNRVALERGKRAPVALRVNPDVDALTHEKISTGKAENKFGIDVEQARAILGRAGELPGIRFEGLAVHIGSQLTELAPFRAAFQRVAGLYGELRAGGIGLRRLDLGGGLGISYQTRRPPDLAGYAAIVREATAGLEAELVFEPGRVLVADAGVLITRVLYVKDSTSRRFVIVDAAMNDLIRPTLYDAWHDILPVSVPAPGHEAEPVDVVGPICESSDTFARQRPLPPLASGDLLAICSTGAYGAVMSSAYNSRLPAPEVMVRGAETAIVRPRLDYATLLEQDRLPDWLEAPTMPASRGAA
ncbi:MAG: diaminopimelate decarboxylase [Rhodospirillales bacterium]|nr:diaminopimelate decarboxylase [Rhodospirillales bacterium]